MKLLKAIVTVILAALILGCIYLLTVANQNKHILVLMIIVLAGVMFLLLRKKEKHIADSSSNISKNEQTTQPNVEIEVASNVQPTEVSTPEINTIKRDSRKFTIAGVTYQGRQTYLRKISEYEEPFVGCMFDLRKTEFKGETAFEIVALLDDGKAQVLGNIGKRDINKVEEIYDSITGVDVEVYGGPDYAEDDKNYGASVELFLD